MGTLANSQDPDVMSRKAAFHQGQLCVFLLRYKRSSGTEIHHFIENLISNPFKYKINWQFHTYCTNMYRVFHQNEKGESGE